MQIHWFVFQTDWKDGIVLCELTKSLGVPAKYQKYDDPDVWESNLNAGMHIAVYWCLIRKTLFVCIFFAKIISIFVHTGMNAGKKLGVEPLLKAKDVSGLNASHLGMMSYVSSFQ